MLIGQIRIPINMWQIEEILDKRVGEQKLSIQDLFLVWSSEAAIPNPAYYDTEIQTKYGRLKVYFTPDCPKNKSYILHTSKFKFPTKGNAIFTQQGELIH